MVDGMFNLSIADGFWRFDSGGVAVLVDVAEVRWWRWWKQCRFKTPCFLFSGDEFAIADAQGRRIRRLGDPLITSPLGKAPETVDGLGCFFNTLSVSCSTCPLALAAQFVS